jgi:hypothetical protein
MRNMAVDDRSQQWGRLGAEWLALAQLNLKHARLFLRCPEGASTSPNSLNETHNYYGVALFRRMSAGGSETFIPCPATRTACPSAVPKRRGG